MSARATRVCYERSNSDRTRRVRAQASARMGASEELGIASECDIEREFASVLTSACKRRSRESVRPRRTRT